MRASQGGRGGRGKRGRKLRRAREASSVKVSDRSDACLPQLENSLHQCDFFHVQLARYQVKYIFMRLQLVICDESCLKRISYLHARARSLQSSTFPIPPYPSLTQRADRKTRLSAGQRLFPALILPYPIYCPAKGISLPCFSRLVESGTAARAVSGRAVNRRRRQSRTPRK